MLWKRVVASRSKVIRITRTSMTETTDSSKAESLSITHILASSTSDVLMLALCVVVFSNCLPKRHWEHSGSRTYSCSSMVTTRRIYNKPKHTMRRSYFCVVRSRLNSRDIRRPKLDTQLDVCIIRLFFSVAFESPILAVVPRFAYNFKLHGSE